MTNEHSNNEHSNIERGDIERGDIERGDAAAASQPTDEVTFEGDVNRRLARVWRDSRLGPTIEHLRRQILHDGEHQIELAQYRLLHALNEHGPMSMRALADTVGATPSSISRTVQRLEAAGLASREQSRRDHRSFTVSATERGIHIHTQLISRAFGLYEEIFAVFTLDEREDLADLLERLLKSADATLSTRGTQSIGESQSSRTNLPENRMQPE